MSVTVYDGGTIIKSPGSSRLITVDWTADIGDASIVTSTWTIVNPPDGAFTVSNPSIVSGSKKASVLLVGGTLNRDYTLKNVIVNNASPAETEEATVTVRIRTQ